MANPPQLPSRSLTIDTAAVKAANILTGPITSSENKRIHDINENIPDPSQLLSQRLDNWVHAIYILIDYVEAYLQLTKREIQGYEKIKKSIDKLPRFTRYEGKLNDDIGDDYGNSKIFLPKGPNKLNSGMRTSTMGSSEIVLDALSSPIDPTPAPAPAPAPVPAPDSKSSNNDSTSSLPSYTNSLTGPKRVTTEDLTAHNHGIDGLFELLRVKNDLNLTSINNLDKQIRIQVLPVFKKEILEELLKYKKQFNNTIDKNSKTLKKIEKSKSRLVNELESAIKSYSDYKPLISSNGLVENVVAYEKDPFLVKKLFFKNLSEQFNLENKVIDELINSKEEIFQLEIKTIEMIKKLIILLNNFQIDHFEELLNHLNIINREFSLMDNKFEITKFLNNNLDSNNLTSSATSKTDNKEDLLTLLSSKLPQDQELVTKFLKKDINYIKVDDPLLFKTINHDSTIPILKDLITYHEVRKLSIKDRIQKDSLKYDYFALTKLKYLFVFGTDNEITTSNAIKKANDTIDDQTSKKLLTSTDKEFFKGELEPSLVFYLPRCSVIDEDEEVPGLGRSKSLKSKFGSIKKKLHDKPKFSSNEYQIKFVGIDLNHRILSKFSKSAHKRTIIMKFTNREQFLLWNNLLREMSGDMEELAEDFDDKLYTSPANTSANSVLKTHQSLSSSEEVPEDSKDILSDHLNEKFEHEEINSRKTSFDENLSDPGLDSIYDLREAIKKDRDQEKPEKIGATFVEEPEISKNDAVKKVEVAEPAPESAPIS